LPVDTETQRGLEKIVTGERDNGAAAKGGLQILPPPQAPMAVARVLARDAYTHSTGTPTLRHWRGGWWLWQRSRWVEIEHRAARSMAYAFTEHAVYPDAKGAPVAWAPNRHKIADLLEALAAVCHLPEAVAQPSWIQGGNDGVIVACANGLLDVGSRELLDHDPRFFNQTAVPFAYEPDAPDPVRWLGFLDELWPNDSASIAAISEWFGYIVSGRLDLHKILLLVGPTRGGKGAIARVQGALIGRENVAGPTLSSLAGDFGLAPLLGKPLAVISDARLSGRGSQVVVERLLAISGEDTITVNRKYRDQWTGKLPSRFMVISNELPQLGDASAAIAGRFVALLLSRSWLGEEDHTLEPELHAELPGILNWALDGLQRLSGNNTFTRPESTDEAVTALRDLASPVAAFIRDQCVTGTDKEVAVDDLWDAWKVWAENNGHARSTKQVLGRNLRAALPRVRVVQPRQADDRYRAYAGVALRKEPHE
jgi:putative DNA primase/helicase